MFQGSPFDSHYLSHFYRDTLQVLDTQGITASLFGTQDMSAAPTWVPFDLASLLQLAANPAYSHAYALQEAGCCKLVCVWIYVVVQVKIISGESWLMMRTGTTVGSGTGVRNSFSWSRLRKEGLWINVHNTKKLGTAHPWQAQIPCSWQSGRWVNGGFREGGIDE